jgi:hypothetical protein
MIREARGPQPWITSGPESVPRKLTERLPPPVVAEKECKISDKRPDDISMGTRRIRTQQDMRRHP